MKRILVFMLVAFSFSGCQRYISWRDAGKKHLGTLDDPIEIVIVDAKKDVSYNQYSSAAVLNIDVTNNGLLEIRLAEKSVVEDHQCREYSLLTELHVNKSNPPQLLMHLKNVNEQPVRASNKTIVCTQFFDLSPLKKRYKSGKFMYESVILNINGRNYGEYSLIE